MSTLIWNAPVFRRWTDLVWNFVLAVALLSVVPALAAEREPYQQVRDLAVYLGVMPAAVVRGHPPAHAERSMHGGASPHGRNEYHITIALFEHESGKRVENADVSATVSGLGHVGTIRLHLEPMSIAQTVTYGGFVTMPGNERYTIAVEIRRPGSEPPVKAEFTYELGQ